MGLAKSSKKYNLGTYGNKKKNFSVKISPYADQKKW